MTCDVFEKHPFGLALADDAGHLWPEVPRVVSTATLTGGAEGLARISGGDGVEGTAEGSGIECPQIIPDWRGGEIPGALGGDENCAGPVFPFHKCAGVIAGFSEHDAQIQASAACAEGQSTPGT
jgi:hypothetical protein